MAISIDPLRPDYTAVQDQAEKLADRLRACPEGLSFDDAAQIAALFAITGGTGMSTTTSFPLELYNCLLKY